MKSKTKKLALLSLVATMSLSCGFAVAAAVPNYSAPATVNAEETQSVDGVAKVGTTAYATIEEAIVNWVPNTTLTLLSDVTLTDVITLKSTEHHILNLGSYTMTAATSQHAILITPEGVGTAAKSCLTINADSENPGGITATGKSCIYYNNANKIADRMMVTINGGVFKGSYTVNSTTGPLNKFGVCQSPVRGQSAPYYVINGGIFEAQILLNAAMLKVTGGTFHKNLTCYGDSTAYRSITGGRFSSMTMTADAEGKFLVGSKQTINNATVCVYDKGLYVDEEGYLIVCDDVITEAGTQFEASISASVWNSCLKYSTAADYELFYETAIQALKKNTTVTLYVDEIDLTGITTKMSGSVLLKEDDAVTIYFDKQSESKLPTFKTKLENKKVVYEDLDVPSASADGTTVIKRTYRVVDDLTLCKVNDTLCKTALEFVNAIEENATITLYENISLYEDDEQPVALTLLNTELPTVLKLPKGVTINGNGKTIDGTIYTDSDLTIKGDITITTLYICEGSTIEGAGEYLTATTTYNVANYTLSITPNKTALQANESMTVTVSIDKAYYSVEYTFTYDTSKFTCTVDSDNDGKIYVTNRYKGKAGDLATYTLVAKNGIDSVSTTDMAVTGNVIQYQEQILNGIENKVIGDTETITISLNYTTAIKADYVNGYSLVLVKGDDAGYAYNGVKMFYVEAYEAYAFIVEGKVTEADVDVAISKTTNCEVIKPSYDVNMEYVPDGMIDLKDATAVYSCTILDFDVEDYMELFLRADVNGDGRVNVIDINAVTKNYTK